MKRTLALALAAGLGLPALAQDPPKTVPATPLKKPGEDPPKADDKKDEKKPETRDEKVAALQKEMSAEQSKLIKEYNAEEDKDAKNKLRDKIIGLPASYADKALALAEENPKDEAGLKAIQMAINFGRGGKATQAATKLLVAHHVENPKIADMVVALGRGASGDTVSFLKAVLARNPDRDAKGRAAYSLAQGLADQIENAKTDEAAAKLETEAVALLKRIGDEFADVHLMKIPAGAKIEPRLLGKLAAADAKGIGNIKNLRPGKPAPEIEGPDMDEKVFKLSDYKGKVVLLDFWGHW